MRPFAKLSLIVMCAQGTTLAVAFWTGRFVDGVSRHQLSGVERGLIGIAIFLVLGQMFQYLLATCHIRDIVFRLEAHISDLTIRKISRFSLGQVVNQNSGFKQDTLKKGEAAISELVQTLFMDAIPAAIRIATTVIACFFIGYQISLVAAASIFCFIAVSYRVNKKMLPRIRQNRKMESNISMAYWEMIKHLKLVIASAQEKRALTEYDGEFKKYGDHGIDTWTKYVSSVAVLREPFAVLGQVGVYGTAAWLVWQGHIALGDLVTVIGWAAIAFSALLYVGNTQRRLARNFVLTGRYFDLLDIPPAIEIIQNPVRLESFRGKIEFRNVHFAYPQFSHESEADEEETPSGVEPEKPVALESISLTINRGEVVALVGPSGSGKSTFVNLLQRGYDPDQGKILIDGQDLRQLDLKRWRELMGIVDQDPKLWDQTLRYNILYGLNGSAGKVTESELESIACKAKIDEFYHRLGPKKLDTMIGENGIQLSGGQRQRVAIARAIIKNPDLLILDEATNALDPLNERLVHGAIRIALEGRTGIIIAHRLSTIRNADKIVVFEKGRIVGIGKHRELLESCSQYNELVSYETAMS